MHIAYSCILGALFRNLSDSGCVFAFAYARVSDMQAGLEQDVGWESFQINRTRDFAL